VKMGFLGDALSDPEPGVREQALRLAEERLPHMKGLLASLVKLVDDPSPRVRFQLAITLGASDDPERLSALAELLRRPDTDSWTQTAIFSSCGKQAWGLLTAWLKQDHTKEELEGKRLATVRRWPAWWGPRPMRRNWRESSTACCTRGNAAPGRWGGWFSSKGSGKGCGAVRSRWWGCHWRGRNCASCSRSADGGGVRQDAGAAGGGDPAAGSFLVCRFGEGISRPAVPAAAAGGTAGGHHTVAPLPEKAWRPCCWSAGAVYSPAVRRECAEALFARSERILALLDAVEKKQVLANHLEPARIALLKKHRDEAVRQKAEKVFAGAVAVKRQQVIDAYKDGPGPESGPRARQDGVQERCAPPVIDWRTRAMRSART